MEILVKNMKLTKSRIKQMDYIGIIKNSKVEILGWVNIDNKKYVIAKYNENYYRAEYIVDVTKGTSYTQFSLGPNQGYEYVNVIEIKCNTFNGGISNHGYNRDDSKNLELYNILLSVKEKTQQAGQIYY